MPSEKILNQKKAFVEDLTNRLKNSCTGILVNYKGINVSADTMLRKELREAGVDYTVIKNTLLLRAAEKAGLESLSSVLEGTTALATSSEYVVAAKILCEFSEKNKTFEIKNGFVEGKVINSKEVKNLAKLPSKKDLVAQVLYGLNAPIKGLATVLSGTIKSLVVALNAIKNQKSTA